jgi:hypothetical protein
MNFSKGIRSQFSNAAFDEGGWTEAANQALIKK